MSAKVKSANGKAKQTRGDALPVPAALDVLMGKSQVCRALGIGMRKLESMMSAGEFPKPETYLAGAKWRTSVVNDWIEGLCEKGSRV